jgi:hypothetical protein
MSLSFKPIRPLLQTGTNALSRWFSYIGLGIGVLLLLCSIQMYINIQQMLKGGSIRKDGSDFISITKTVTNETMGQLEKNLFNAADIAELKSKPFLEDVAPLEANQFQVELSAAGILPFRTNLFLETIENSFLDTIPPGFQWEVGQTRIPIIISSDFLEIFNVFGPSYNLPQVSQETASGIPVLITCHGDGDLEQTFQGQIVAFSDRINSVLVPKNFLDWANLTFKGKRSEQSSRLYIKTKDANNPDLLNFLDQKHYKVNKDKTKFGRMKQVFQGIFSGLAVFGLLVVVLALMLFSFYLQLVIARSKDSLRLLLMLGYSPGWLSKNVSRRFIPVYILIVFTALAFAQLMQWAFHHIVMYDRPELSTMVNWIVILVAFLLILLSLVTNYRLVKKLLYKLH